MEKYTILSAVRNGSFEERLCHLYMKMGDYLDIESLEHRKLHFCRVFLSDAKNQYKQLMESQLWKELLSEVPCSIVEQQPLDGSKISLLVKTADHNPDFTFSSLRLTDDEAEGKDTYEQTVMLYERYIKDIESEGMTIANNCIRTWIYVNDIDVNYAAVVKARNDVFSRNGLTADTHYIASTGIQGCTQARKVNVAIDFLTYPQVRNKDIRYLTALEHLSLTSDYGVSFERGTRVTRNGIQRFFISGTASIDKEGNVLYLGDVKKQTGRLLENIGALLNDGGATMNDVRCFIIYLRDISDYAEVDKFMSIVFPYTPRIILQAKVCRPEWLIEMECVAVKEV